MGPAGGFQSVVLGGALTENGMLPFDKTLSAEDVEAIRAHITKLSNDLKKDPQAQAALARPGGQRISK